MERIELKAQPREILGKKVRFLRQKGLTPANLYGPKIQSLPLQVDTASVKGALNRGGRNALISLKVDGQADPYVTIVRDIQRDPKRGSLLHVDFLLVDIAERMHSEVPLMLIGQAPAEKTYGGVIYQSLNALTVEGLPLDLPKTIEVDTSHLDNIEDEIRVSSLTVPPNITVLTDPDQLVVKVHAPRVEVEEVEEVAEEEEAPVEGEEAEAKAEEPTEDTQEQRQE